MPVNLLKIHWALIIFFIDDAKAFFLNSIEKDHSYEQAAQTIYKKFLKISKFSTFKFMKVKSIQQINGDDCGVHTIYNCLKFLEKMNLRDKNLLSDMESSKFLNFNDLDYHQTPIIFNCEMDVIKDLRETIKSENEKMDSEVIRKRTKERSEYKEYIPISESKGDEEGEVFLVPVPETTNMEFYSSPLSINDDEDDLQLAPDVKELGPVKGMNIND